MTLTPSREFSTEYFARYQFFEVPDWMSVLKKHQVDTRLPVGKNEQLEKGSGPRSWCRNFEIKLSL